jgi:hypothetical protein
MHQFSCRRRDPNIFASLSPIRNPKSEGISNLVTNALKKIEIEEASISKFMGLPELLSIQYITNMSPLTLSLSPGGEG